MLRRILTLAATGALFLAAAAAHAAGHTSLTWYGHAAFKIVTPEGHVLFVDPWITNPSNPKGKEDLAAIDKADLILVGIHHCDSQTFGLFKGLIGVFLKHTLCVSHVSTYGAGSCDTSLDESRGEMVHPYDNGYRHDYRHDKQPEGSGVIPGDPPRVR